MNIQPKTNYSTLFGSLNTSDNGMAGINFSDYASIKNGSYGKLLKAYYAKDDVASDKKSNTKVDADKASEYSAVSSAAKDAAKAADALISKGTESLFKEKDIVSVDEEGKEVTTRGYDMNAIYKSVKSFADKYNAFINKAKKSSSDKVAREADSLANQMNGYYSKLKSVGIEINDNDTLSIDEETFKKSDIGTLKSLFNGNQSTAYQVASKISMIGTTATSEANSAKGYTSAATYADSYSVGNLLNSIV